MVGLDSVAGAHDEQVRSSDKEAGLDDSWNQVQGDLQFSRVIDPWNMDIQNHMARFRIERFAVSFPEHHRTLREGFNCSGRTSPAKRDHFDGEREESPQYGDSLGMVHQDNELFGRGRDYLFFEERAASAFDEIESGIDLIRSVDCDIDDPGIVRIDERDALLRGECGRFLGRGDSAKPHARSDLFPQREDHVFRRRASPKPDDHSIADVFDGFERGRFLEAVEVLVAHHDTEGRERVAATDAAPSKAVC